MDSGMKSELKDEENFCLYPWITEKAYITLTPMALIMDIIYYKLDRIESMREQPEL
jgi:hypothetical protein